MGIPCTYRVILGNGNYGDEYFFWTDTDKVRELFGRYGFRDNVNADLNSIDLGHVVGGAKRGEVRDCASFSRKDWNSLVFRCNGKESANKCIEFLGFSDRFR
ncbi:MAG: hypothetical protein KJ592_00390 [Nanoarchaeota archaeon]|nr:hypothetical protein [Nanoarchaeota archaeon]